MHANKNEWMDGLMDRWRDGWTDGWVASTSTLPVSKRDLLLLKAMRLVSSELAWTSSASVTVRKFFLTLSLSLPVAYNVWGSQFCFERQCRMNIHLTPTCLWTCSCLYHVHTMSPCKKTQLDQNTKLPVWPNNFLWQKSQLFTQIPFAIFFLGTWLITFSSLRN